MTEDEKFIEEFEACRFSLDQWRHREHIKLAYLYLCQYSFEETLSKVRTGIKKLNETHNIPDLLTRGYHETITGAWLHLVSFVLQEYGPSKSADQFCDDHPELLEKKALRLFYSQTRILSAEAKASFMEPDLTEFPVSKSCGS